MAPRRPKSGQQKKSKEHAKMKKDDKEKQH